MWIRPGHERLQYTGRIDWSDCSAPVFVFPCTSVRIRFTGHLLKVHVRNKRVYWENYVGCIADGIQTKMRLPDVGEAVLEIPLIPAGSETADADRSESQRGVVSIH